MTANPYATISFQKPIGSAPVSAPLDAGAPTKPKTNWMIAVGGLIGLVFGLMNAKFPPMEQFLSGSVRPEAIGFVFGQVGGSLILGLIFGWIAWQVFSRPIRAMIVFAIFAGIAALGIYSGKINVAKLKHSPHRSVTPSLGG